jgi:hypothetical protein
VTINHIAQCVGGVPTRPWGRPRSTLPAHPVLFSAEDQKVASCPQVGSPVYNWGTNLGTTRRTCLPDSV